MVAYEWLLLPAAASVLLCLLLVPLGYQVIARGVIFADLAMAQWAALGTLVGIYAIPTVEIAGTAVSSLVFALIAATTVQLILKLAIGANEAWIGTLYVVGASLSVLLVSHDPHGAQSLHSVASGDLLWASQETVWAIMALTVLIWALNRWRPEWSSGPAFLPVFAIAVTYSVSLAGIYVVFATLIITPLIQGRILNLNPLPAALCAMMGQLVAIAVSVAVDLPVGPALVVLTLLSALLWLGVWRLKSVREAKKYTT